MHFPDCGGHGDDLGPESLPDDEVARFGGVGRGVDAALERLELDAAGNRHLLLALSLQLQQEHVRIAA